MSASSEQYERECVYMSKIARLLNHFNMRVYQHVKDCTKASSFQFESLSAYQII